MKKVIDEMEMGALAMTPAEIVRVRQCVHGVRYWAHVGWRGDALTEARVSAELNAEPRKVSQGEVDETMTILKFFCGC